MLVYQFCLIRIAAENHKEKRGYWKLKEEALDLTLWKTRFGRGCGPDVKNTTE